VSSSDLPIIRIIAMRDAPYVELDLEMEDETHEMLVRCGKKEASDQDYVNIAIRKVLQEYADSEEEEDFVELHPFLQEKYNLTSEGKPRDE